MTKQITQQQAVKIGLYTKNHVITNDSNYEIEYYAVTPSEITLEILESNLFYAKAKTQLQIDNKLKTIRVSTAQVKAQQALDREIAYCVHYQGLEV